MSDAPRKCPKVFRIRRTGFSPMRSLQVTSAHLISHVHRNLDREKCHQVTQRPFLREASTGRTLAGQAFRRSPPAWGTWGHFSHRPVWQWKTTESAKEPHLATTSTIHDMDSYRQRNDEQQQRKVVSGAILNVARELRRLEKLTDETHGNGGGGRAG